MLSHKQLTQHFNSSEFDSPDQEYSGLKMDLNFIKQLQKARLIAEEPFQINSGFRTEAHNLLVKGSINSAHLKGFAADIHVINALHRYKIVTSLLLAGFTRIGIGKNFVHVDNDPTKLRFCIWTY